MPYLQVPSPASPLNLDSDQGAPVTPTTSVLPIPRVLSSVLPIPRVLPFSLRPPREGSKGRGGAWG
eukprot:1223348-Pyramimonas_sp.AAC.1